jgi:hypothetical protein
MAKKINTPKEKPQMVSASESASGARPLENFMVEEEVAKSSIDDEASPSNLPPGETAEIEEAFGASVWYNNKKIVGLWSDKDTRNSWANIQGMGWKKVSTANNSSSSSLTMILAHARERSRTVKIQLDNNLISQVYAW